MPGPALRRTKMLLIEANCMPSYMYQTFRRAPAHRWQITPRDTIPPNGGCRKPGLFCILTA